jgi:hypothetical protein
MLSSDTVYDTLLYSSCYLLSVICYLLSVICYLLSYLQRLSVIFLRRSNKLDVGNIEQCQQISKVLRNIVGERSRVDILGRRRLFHLLTVFIGAGQKEYFPIDASIGGYVNWTEFVRFLQR